MSKFTIPTLAFASQPQRCCPSSQRPRAWVHQLIQQPIRDTHWEAIRQGRMRCAPCGLTFTLYPEGVPAYQQRSQRALGVVLYQLGLSYRAVEALLTGLGVKVSDTTVLREVVQAGEKARQRHENLKGKVEKVGVDGTGVLLAGGGCLGVILAVGIDNAQLLRVRVAEEEAVEEVKGILGS